MKNNYLYICYSNTLMKFLKENGIKYEIAGKALSNDKTFWVYIKNDKLDKELTKWSVNRKTLQNM